MTAAVEKAGQGDQQHHGVKHAVVVELLLQPGNKEDDRKAKQPAAEDVGGIMDAQAETGHADQQREKHGDHREGLVLPLIERDGAVDGHRVCGMAAGEGILLSGDVEDIRVLLNRLETLDLGRVKIRSAAENGAFDHGIQHQGEERVHAHEAAEALVIAPVDKTEHRHAGQLLTEGGDKRSQRGPKAAHMCLQPDDQVNLPLEEKSIAGQFHIIDLPYRMSCYYSAFRRRSRGGSRMSTGKIRTGVCLHARPSRQPASAKLSTKAFHSVCHCASSAWVSSSGRPPYRMALRHSSLISAIPRSQERITA